MMSNFLVSVLSLTAFVWHSGNICFGCTYSLIQLTAWRACLLANLLLCVIMSSNDVECMWLAFNQLSWFGLCRFFRTFQKINTSNIKSTFLKGGQCTRTLIKKINKFVFTNFFPNSSFLQRYTVLITYMNF